MGTIVSKDLIRMKLAYIWNIKYVAGEHTTTTRSDHWDVGRHDVVDDVAYLARPWGVNIPVEHGVDLVTRGALIPTTQMPDVVLESVLLRQSKISVNLI